MYRFVTCPETRELTVVDLRSQGGRKTIVRCGLWPLARQFGCRLACAETLERRDAPRSDVTDGSWEAPR